MAVCFSGADFSLCCAAIDHRLKSVPLKSVNLIQLQDNLKNALRAAAHELFDIEIEQIAAEVPPRTEMGDLAFPIAFELAKQIKQRTGEKRPPRAIAESLKPFLETINEV